MTGIWENFDRRFVLSFAALIIVFAGTLVVLYLVTDRLETIEDRLGYVPPEAGGVTALPPDADGGYTVYVPVYSHVFTGGGRPFLLEATLSVRNTDADDSLTITRVDYYDNDGTLTRQYLEAPMTLGPMASTAFLVEQRDTAGGVGANFIVRWVAEGEISEPVIDAVMVGVEGNRSISFARSGVPVDGP